LYILLFADDKDKLYTAGMNCFKRFTIPASPASCFDYYWTGQHQIILEDAGKHWPERTFNPGVAGSIPAWLTSGLSLGYAVSARTGKQIRVGKGKKW
jgi:hypothetical protein